MRTATIAIPMSLGFMVLACGADLLIQRVGEGAWDSLELASRFLRVEDGLGAVLDRIGFEFRKERIPARLQFAIDFLLDYLGVILFSRLERMSCGKKAFERCKGGDWVEVNAERGERVLEVLF